MSDSKFFARGKVDALRVELQTAGDRKDKGYVKTKGVLKKVVANMTMGIDMSPLFSEVVACMNIQVLEIKKMVYLYLVNYARSKPDMMKFAMNGFLSDSNDRNPLIRALAIRTMSYIQVSTVIYALVDPLRHALKDADPYVRKTAAICVGKLFMIDKRLVEKEDFVSDLRDLLADGNPTVVANAVAALIEISERSDNVQLRLNASIASKLVSAMGECSEWGQTYILEALMYFIPEESEDAEITAERIAIRLQHANSAVVLTTIKVILHLMNYIQDENRIDSLCRKLSPPLVTLLSSGYEVQYVALRNILLIIQRRPAVLRNDVKVFFCKYNDPIYVKLSKLEIIYRLADRSNVAQVLAELQEYASEVDVDFVRKAVRAIGRVAIKISSAADQCIEVLLELVSTKISYVVQEAVVVIKDVFRKYPNQYEGIIATLCEQLDALDTPEAKAAMIWIVGQYADRIENSDELLEDFLRTFLEEPAEVQLALLTATVKLFIKRPTAGQDLVPKVLKWATEQIDNPDIRDRGYIYWRLLSTDPVAAKDIVLSDKPSINTEAEAMETSVLDRLLLHTGSLASVYHQMPETFIRNTKPKRLQDSHALNAAARSSMNAANPAPIPQPSTSRQHSESQLLSMSTNSNGDRPPLPPKRMDTSASMSAYNTMGIGNNNDLLGDIDDDRSPTSAVSPLGGLHDPYAGLGGAFGGMGVDDNDDEGQQGILGRRKGRRDDSSDDDR